MAGKITIRRKGGCFPTLCLLLLFTAVVVVLWLSMLGVPDSALRRIEQLAAQQGIHLRIGSIKLAPSSGLAVQAEDVELRAAASDEEPLATLGKAVVSMRLSGLMSGDFLPKSIALARGKAKLPVDGRPGEYFDINLTELNAKNSKENVLRLSGASLQVEGVSLKLRGTVDLTDLLNAESPSSDSQALNLPELLETIRPQIREAYRVIHSQQWQEGEAPALDIDFRAAKELRATLHLGVPRYDVELFHFRNGEASLEFRNNTVVIHELKCHTVEPDSDIRLQGGYDIDSRLLSFRINSNAALIRMAERLVDEGPTRTLLGKIRHADADAPVIKLSGHLRFTESYTPEDIKLQGELSQQRLSIGKSLVNNAELSFHYDNGNCRIHKCALAMPDGELKLEASLKDGDGQAELSADIDVAQLLALVSEFTPEPLVLPQDLSLRGHTRLSLNIGLNAPPFKPGKIAWEDLVPHLEKLSLSVDVDEADYGDFLLTGPAVSLGLYGIEQGADMLPTGIGQCKVGIRLANSQWRRGDDAPGVSLEKLSLELSCNGIELTGLDGDTPRVAVRQGDVLLNVRRPAHGTASAEEVSLALIADKGFRLSDKPTEILQNAKLELRADGLRDAGCDLGKAQLTATLDETQPDSAQVVFHLTNAEGRTLFLKMQPDWARPDRPALHGIEAELPLAAFSPILAHFGIETDAILWPENTSLRGYAEFDTENNRLTEGQLRLSIPQLVRTPTTVKALVGQNVTLGIEATAHLATPPTGVLGFTADVEVTQQTGSFKGQISGDVQGRLHVTGHNTIRADVIDALIDLNDAHDIIRDFRFNSASKNIASEIDVDIDLTDAGGGVRVDSFCKAELFNIAYMLGGIENAPNGTERVRTDLGSDPFTHCTHATCSVLVHVVDGCTTPAGAKVPNECTITLSNAMLEYDNTPWLRRQGFKDGPKTSSLMGDSVVIDVEHSFVEINNIVGTVYPAYSFGMFYPDLQDFMSDVLFYSPVDVETPQCVFPIYSDCTRPMSGTIFAHSTPEGGFRFIGTTIPLSNFSGVIYLTDDYVQLDQLNALCWEGVLNAVVNIGFSGKHTTFDGYATAGAMNLKCIAAAYGSEQNNALCDASIRFRAASPELQDIQAYGYVNIQDGDLLSLRIFRPVGELVSDIPGYFSKLEQSASKALGAGDEPGILSWIFDSTGHAVSSLGGKLDSWSNKIPFANHILAYNLKEAYSRFSIGNGYLVTHGMKAKGSNLKINAELSMNLDDLNLRGNLWPSISSLPTVILSPITFLSKYVIDITVEGPVDHLKWGFGLDRRLKNSEPSATSCND